MLRLSIQPDPSRSTTSSYGSVSAPSICAPVEIEPHTRVARTKRIRPCARTGRRTRQLRLERAMDGVWTRVKLACAAFFTILFKGTLPAALQRGATAPTPAPKVPVVADAVDRAVQILALLQRDGRLVDFLMEDVT